MTGSSSVCLAPIDASLVVWEAGRWGAKRLPMLASWEGTCPCSLDLLEVMEETGMTSAPIVFAKGLLCPGPLLGTSQRE